MPLAITIQTVEDQAVHEFVTPIEYESPKDRVRFRNNIENTGDNELILPLELPPLLV